MIRRGRDLTGQKAENRIHSMERLELSQNLSKAFEVWKTKREDSAGLNRAIETVIANGIGLVLRIPKNVFRTTATQPISRRNAIDFAREEADFIVFDIPSNLSKGEVQPEKRFELVAMDDWRHKEPPSLLIKNGDGVFGTFSSDQVAALEVK
jgi:hypothetical protein